MKKNLFFALAASALVLTACSSKEDEPFGGARPEAHPVEITFDLAVNSGIESRGGRELWSSEALQSVKYVDIYMFGADGNYIKTLSTKDANTLKANESDFAETGTQSTESHAYRFVENMSQGTYTFLAVGYEEVNETVYTMTTPTATTKVEDLLLQLQENAVEEEVFVGLSQSYEIGEEATSLYASVTLYRAVAGVLGYFKHIPYEISVETEDGTSVKSVKVTRLAVRVIGKANAVKMPTDNTENKLVTTNGNAIAGYRELMSFDLSLLGKSTNGNWYEISTDNWTAEGLDKAPTGVTKVKDSVVGGHFILPFSRRIGEATSEMATMEVVLYYKDADQKEQEGKVYKVYCKQEDTSATQTKKEKDERFSIFANHFYGLGQKYHNDPAKPFPGTDPDNPDPDPTPDPEPKPNPDEPIDLSAVEYITITVKASWDMIHHLGLKLD